MTCSCLKCHAQIEVDLNKIPENGTFTSCPECKGRFWINRESYSRMALKKDGNTYCDQCGTELDHKIVCTACGVMFPDYYLLQASRPPRRQVEKPDLFSLSFSLKPAKPTYSYTYTSASAKESYVRPQRSVFKITGIVAVIILIAIALGFFYQNKKAERMYAVNYMRTLYTIKTGMDISENLCQKVSNDWKTNLNEGQDYVPIINTVDESHLNRVKDATDRFIKKLNKPPKKFVGSNNKLINLYGVYTKAYEIAVTPTGSLSSFSSSASKTQNDFNAAIKDLKQSLPKELSDELKVAQNKYKGFKDI
jgi:hypothetical protein